MIIGIIRSPDALVPLFGEGGIIGTEMAPCRGASPDVPMIPPELPQSVPEGG